MTIDTAPLSHGLALARVLDEVFDELGVSRERWAKDHGFNPATVARWWYGGEPTLPLLDQVARALGWPLAHLLVKCGYYTPEDGLLDPIGVIRSLPGLTRPEADTLVSVLTGMRRVAAGEVDEVVYHRPATSESDGRQRRRRAPRGR